MICTVTFNPSLDYIVRVDDMRLGVINRTTYEQVLPGGKGINVSIVLGNLGHDRAIAVFERNGVVQIGKLTVGEANIKDRSDNLYDSTGIWQYGHSFQDCSAPATISVISCVIAP